MWTDSWSSRSDAGREFHVAGPAMAKLQGLYQTVFVAGTTRSPLIVGIGCWG